MNTCGTEGRNCYHGGVDPKQFRLSLFTAEFVSAETEQAFQEEKWAERSRQNKIVAWIWTSAVLGIWLWTGLNQPDLWGTWSVAANLFAGFCILLASKRREFYIHYDLVFCLILLLLLMAMSLVVVEGKPGNPLWISLFITIPLLTNIALSIRSLYAWIVTAFGVVVFYRMLKAQDLDPDFIQLLTDQMLISSGVGLVIHRLISASRRLEFSKLFTEKDLNERLAIAKAEAEKANRAKTEFLASMSHELRTPMNGVLGLSALLVKDNLSSGQRELVEGVRVSASSLMSLLDDLLDLSKIEAGKLRLKSEPFSLGQLLLDSVNIIQPMADEKGLKLCHHLESDSRKGLLGDPQRLKQVLINLLMNAVKFTEKGRIDLVAVEEPERNGKKKIAITIRDTGKGIAVEEQEKIFDKFYQGSGVVEKKSGSGLGLAIVRELLDQMGGSITVESCHESGTSFRILWESEVVDLPGTKIESPCHARVQWKEKTVLLVEDNRINALVAAESLKGLGIGTVRVAGDGFEFLRMAGEKKYDVIFLDLAMPNMDGFEAIEKFRRNPGPNSGTPVVAMTAYVDEAHREQCRQAGMRGFIPKPFQERELADLLSLIFATGDEGELSRVDFSRKYGDALRRMGGNLPALKDALRMAAEDFPHYLSEIRRSVDAGKVQEASRLAHTWKGAAAVLNAEKIEALSGQLERSLGTNSTEEMRLLLEALERETCLWLSETGDFR